MKDLDYIKETVFQAKTEFLNTPLKTVVNYLVGACLLVMVGVQYFEKKSYRAEIIDIKEATAAVMVEKDVKHAKALAELEAKLVKVQALNKVLLKQLDTKAEQIEDVKTYIQNTTKTVGSDIAQQIAEAVVKNGEKYNVPTPVVISVMEVESHFNLQAIGGVGERGLMQVRHNVWGKKLNIKSKYDLHNIQIGVKKGVEVLDISLKDCKYDLAKAVRMYNSGSTSRGSALYVANVMKSMGKYEAHTALRQIIRDKQKREVNDVETKSIQNTDTGTDKGTGKTTRNNPSPIYPGGKG